MIGSKLFARYLSMAAAKLNLKGVYTPLITPFTSKGDIDFEKVEYNVKKFEDEVPLTGYAVGGSNSEVAALTPAERIDLVKRVRKLIKSDRMILGGATAESTKLAIEMSKAMAEVGANGVLVMTPFYFKNQMKEEAIIRHFLSVADASPIPVVIYNMSVITGVEIGVNVLKKLSEHPNIRGVKDSDVRKMALTVMETEGNNFDVLAGSAGYLFPAMQLGGSGGIVALAGPLGPEVCHLVELVNEKKWEEAIALQKRIIQVDIIYFGSHMYGVPGVKATMKLRGFKPGFCRAPLIDLDDKAVNNIECVLKTAGFL